MELLQLECFVVLAEELHFGRTAARLHVGTSGLSKRIGELEQRLGVRLFDRTSREVRLTAAGEALLPQVLRTLAEAAALQAMAADAAAGAIGSVRAAYSPGTGELMTLLAGEVRRRTTNVVVHHEQMLSLRITTAVSSGVVAVGLGRVPPGPGMATMVLAESPLNRIAMPATHPLAGRGALRPADLANETFLGPSRAVVGVSGSGPSAHFREADVTSEGELFDLVSSGFGLFLTTEGIVRRNPRRDLVVLPVVGLHATAKEILMWRADDNSPALRTVLEVAEEIRPRLSELAAS
jgi:DNA-binding transcriptional LysR family regulator